MSFVKKNQIECSFVIWRQFKGRDEYRMWLRAGGTVIRYEPYLLSLARDGDDWLASWSGRFTLPPPSAVIPIRQKANWNLNTGLDDLATTKYVRAQTQTKIPVFQLLPKSPYCVYIVVSHSIQSRKKLSFIHRGFIITHLSTVAVTEACTLRRLLSSEM